eukprot:7042498-Pyramimonas_sp.AAC.1
MTRKVLVACRGPFARCLASIKLPPARRVAHGVKHFLGPNPDGDWLDGQGETLLDPKIRTAGNPLLPRPAGHITIEGAEHLLRSRDGPASTP